MCVDIPGTLVGKLSRQTQLVPPAVSVVPGGYVQVDRELIEWR